MIYVLIPKDRTAMRLFTSFSAVEQAVLSEIPIRIALDMESDWCFVLEYNGLDELTCTRQYEIHNNSSLRAIR